MKKRELASWVGLAALGVLVLALCGVVGWSLLPREQRLALGPQSAFPTDRPEYRALDPGIYVYIVNLRGELIAWDANAAVDRPCSRIRWVPTNFRFEDPCTAGMWCLDGTVANSRIGPGSSIRTLDRFRLEVDRDGNVWLHPDQKILGIPVMTATPPGTRSMSATSCDHLNS